MSIRDRKEMTMADHSKCGNINTLCPARRKQLLKTVDQDVARLTGKGK